jgi:hypothetical protein
MGTEFVGGNLTTPETVGEIPQRTLASMRFVDGASRTIIERCLDEEGGVRAPRHTPEHLDLAGAEEFGDLFVGRFLLRGALGVQFSLGHA